MTGKSQPEPACEELDEHKQAVLEQAVEKLLRFGEVVGVTPEEMIQMLDSGLTIGELLNYMAQRKPSCSKCSRTMDH